MEHDLFKVGDRAKVLKNIRRHDGLSMVRESEEVEITQVFNCDDGVQIVGIKMDDKRAPMGDIVCIRGSSPLAKVKPNTDYPNQR